MEKNLLARELKKKKLIRKGYINDVFTGYIDGKKYVLRVPKEKRINYDAEAQVYRSVFGNEYEADYKTGISIRPYIDGKSVNKKSVSTLELNKITQAIENFHKIDLETLPKHDWFEYDKLRKNIDQKVYDKFNMLVNKHRALPLVTSHNDVNLENLVFVSGSAILLDFEWSRLNNAYFDYANFFLHEGLNIAPPTLNKTVLDDMIYVTAVYSLLWTYTFDKKNKKAMKLRKHYEEVITKLD